MLLLKFSSRPEKSVVSSKGIRPVFELEQALLTSTKAWWQISVTEPGIRPEI